MIEQRTFRRAVIAAAAAVVVIVAWIGLQFQGRAATGAFSDLIAIPASFAAVTGCVWAANTAPRRARLAWLLLAAGMGSWCAGEIVWSYYELVLGREVPFPSLADIGYLGVVPLAVVAILAFPTAPRGAAARARALLDGLIIGGSILFIGWATVLGDAFRAGSGGVLGQAIGLAYPLGDLVIISCVLYVLGRAGRKERVALGLICLGLVALSLADSLFTYTTVHEIYVSGTLIDPIWDVGFVLIALGAVRRPIFTASTTDERRVGPTAIIAPYGPFIVAVGVAMYVQITRGRLEPFLFWTAISVVGFLALRQILALVDNWSLNRDLEARVQGRTAELQKALADLEESTRLQDEFVANTSHELLTPLTVILASLETLTVTGAEMSRFVASNFELTQRAAVRMKRLVENVLLTSGVMSRIDCDEQPFDVDYELREAIGVVDPSDKCVELRARVPLQAVGDAERFRMIVQHLLTNADKFAPPGSTITIDAFDDGGFVHITITDEGPGIARDHRERVFRRFYQVDGTSTRHHGGMGLGLFLARQLAVSMGGRLDVDDTSRGARLHLTLAAAGMQDASRPVPVNQESEAADGAA
jgi:signal transduction histidine kinase